MADGQRFANAKRAGYEADDFLAAAAVEEERRGGTVLVASGDRDTFQLASEKTTILYPVKAGETVRIGPKEVRERYGVAPKQVPDFIALRGDPSDRLPGRLASARRALRR
jgi:DNA polymerase I